MAPCVVSHTQGFPEAGVYNISVEVSNDFTVFTSEIYSVGVFNPVPALSVDVTNSSSISDPVELRIYPQSNTSLWPTEAKVVFSVAGFQNQIEQHFVPSSPVDAVGMFFLTLPVYGIFDVAVNVSNAVNFMMVHVPIQIGQEIQGFYARLLSSMHATGENVDLEFGFTAGSDIVFEVDFGDGSHETHQLINSSTIYHKYNSSGEYIITVRAHNDFGDQVRQLSVRIINPINGLRMDTSGNDMVTGEPVQFVFYLEKGAVIPQTVHCSVDYGDGSDIDSWDSVLSDGNITIEHTYSTSGSHQVQANCSNEVSQVDLTVNVTLYTHTAGCIVNVSTVVAATNATVQYLTTVGDGSDINLLIQFGDGTNMSTHIDTVGFMVFEHVYHHAGSYTAHLKASNPISDCEASGGPVTIQVPIRTDSYNLTIIPSTIDVANQTTVFAITLMDEMPLPTNVTASWTFGDGNSSSQILLLGRKLNVSHIFEETGEYEVSVHLSNMVSELDLNDTVVVLERIDDVDYNISTAAAVGDNLTLSILASSGTSLSYNIDFGDGTVVTSFQDKPEILKFAHSYKQVGKYVLTIRVENGLGGIVLNHTKIRVVYPVQGLNFETTSEVIYSPGNITFSLTIDQEVPPPTVMECVWRKKPTTLGLGPDVLWRKKNVSLDSGESLNVTHYFPGGQFVVSLQCKNILGGLTLEKLITVFEDVTHLKIFPENLVAEVGSQVLITITASQGSLLNYAVQYGDGTTETRYVVMSTSTKIQEFQHAYTQPGLFTPSVTAENILGQSHVTSNASIEVLHSTRGFHLLSNSPRTFPDLMVIFQLVTMQGTTPPTTVNLAWNFGDGSVHYETVQFNMTQGINHTHSYNNSGTYHAEVTVTNNLDSHMFETSVIINKEAAPIQVRFEYQNTDGIWTAGLGHDFNWFASDSVIRMSANVTSKDATIIWDFGNGETAPLDIVFRRYETPGVYNITLKVEGHTDEPVELHFIFYIVQPFELTSIQAMDESGLSVLKSGQQVDFILNGNGLEGPMCISWDVGDKTQQIVYGPESCGMTLHNDIIFVQSNQDDGLQVSHTYTSPGYYTVHVSVSNFFTTASMSSEITVMGCWNPPDVSIKGPGETIDAPQSHRTSETILIDSVTTFDCIGVGLTTFTWEVYKLILDDVQNTTQRVMYDVPSVNGPQLQLMPGSLDVGLYEITLTVTVEGLDNATGMDKVYIRINHSPLVLVLEGGSSRSVGNVQPLVLDAMTSSYDPDNVAGNSSDWSFEWTCKKLSERSENNSMTTNVPFASTDYLCENSSWERLNFTSGVLHLNPLQLRVGALYAFKVDTAIGSRLASYQQTIQVMQGEPPVVSIRCVSNCRDKTNPTSSFTLQGSCDNCDIHSESMFTWSLYIKQKGTQVYQEVSNLGDKTSTGVSKQGIAFNPNQLDAGNEYNLRLDVKDALLGNGFIQHSFLTNLPPYNGSCQITPSEGYAVTTEFSVNCTGWLEEGYAVDRASISQDLAATQVLQYHVLSRPMGQTSFSLKTSTTDSSISGILFGVGTEEFSFQNVVRVEVVDVYGAAAYVEMTITVRKPDLSADDITSLVSSNGSKLSLLISSGNVEGATQLISAVLTILQDDNTTMTPEDVTEIRSNLVLELGKISLWAKTAEALLQASSVMSQSLTGGVNDNALIDAAATMVRMAMSLESVDTDNPEIVIETAEGLTGGLGSLIAQSDGIVQNAMGTSEASMYTTTPSSLGTREPVIFDVYGDDLSPEEIAEQAASEKEESERNEENARTVALTISMLAQETLDLVSGVVIGQRVTGQPPVTLVTDELTLEVYKDEPNSVADRVITADAGSFHLPNASSLFGTSGAKHVEQIIYSFNANPYSFSKSSDSIGSKGVLTLEFKTGQGEPLSVQNLTDMISITLDVDDSKVTSAETVQMRFTNVSTMQYHKVEIQEKDIQLRVIFKEISDNRTNFHVYLRKGGHPDTLTYDALTEIPRCLGNDETWSDERLETEARHTAVFAEELLTGVGDYYLGISLADSSQESSDKVDDMMNKTDELYDVNVTMVIYAAGCRYWDSNITAWSSHGCQVGQHTTTHSIHCLCNHLSSFASSFFVPPNTIDFSTVFSKFLNLGDNAAVFATVLGFLGLYLLLLVWLRRKDKQDIIKWGVSPLADNHPSDMYFYQITVQTGMGPGCGTRSKVSIILTGESGDSGVRLLDDDKRKVFESGSICHFLMGVASPLGPLSYIKLWHDNTGPGQLASWYLSQVSILDLQNGKQYFFVCDRWLAVEKDDGAIERVLPVATRSDLTQFSKLFISSSRRNLFDDHIWFSLFSRPTRSPFTRVQRLSCCLCLLYLSMITSAMFYRTEETVENPTALRLGPFIFTLQQVYIGFISALIVVPVNILIVQIFRKSKPSKSQLTSQLPKHLQEKLDNLKDSSPSEDSTPQNSVVDIKSDKVELVPMKTSTKHKVKDQRTKGRPYLLPHWCVYMAWLIMILSSFTAAFFTVLYSLEWGQEKSCEWLTSMLISLFNSVLVIQPFKVVAVAIVLSLIFKKPTKMDVEIDSDFCRYQNQLQNDEELLHDSQSTKQMSCHKYKVRLPPSKEALEEARKKRLKEIKMNRMLKETGIYTIFVIIVLFLCYTNRDDMSFYMSQSLRDVFIENNGAENSSDKLTFHSLEKSTPDLFWTWVETALIPGLYGNAYYNGVPMHWRHTRFIGDWQGYRVGPVRLRQLRVKNEPCAIPPDISVLHPNCHLDYSWSNQDENNFTVAWQPTTEHNSKLYSDEENAPWIYHDFLELNGVPHFGILAVYSGSGYVAEFGTTSAKALETAQFLKDTSWYDELTRAIFVEFSVYNANINLFSVATLLAETSTTGGALVTSYIHTLRLYHYEGTVAIFTIIFQVMFVAYLLFFIIKLLVSLKKDGLKELKNFWTAIELVLILVAISAIVMFALRQVFIELALQEVKNKNQGEFVNFSHIAKWDEVFGYLLACIAFLSLIRYMRLLRLNARMSLLGMTLSHASKDIFYFVIMWNLVFFAFGQLSYILFHSMVETFSSFVSTLETLFSMLLGKFDFHALVEANRMLGGAVFVIYIVTVYMILTNMFITIVVEAFNHMRHKRELDDAVDPEMIEYIVERFKAFFLRPLHRGTTDVPPIKANVTYEDTTNLLEKRVDKIVKFVETNYGKLEISTNQNEATTSPARSLSRISLHSATRSSDGGSKSAKKPRNRVILLA
ncbi:polycystin-1-like [Patiria miniata]|uniref:Uncharacterized protein n=1 Tax=Patiria miniata TaxID=46514 RepID=A0A913ZBQ4_PATMI|nr:polycystin-1-like [Patiria miniata]